MSIKSRRTQPEVVALRALLTCPSVAVHVRRFNGDVTFSFAVPISMYRQLVGASEEADAPTEGETNE